MRACVIQSILSAGEGEKSGNHLYLCDFMCKLAYSRPVFAMS